MIDEKQGKLLNTPSILFIYYQGWSSDDMDYVEIIDSYGMRYEISGDSLKGVKLEDIYDLYVNSQLEDMKKIGKARDLAELKEKYKVFLQNLKRGEIEQNVDFGIGYEGFKMQYARWLGVCYGLIKNVEYVKLMRIGNGSAIPVDCYVENLCYWIHGDPKGLKSKETPFPPES